MKHFIKNDNDNHITNFDNESLSKCENCCGVAFSHVFSGGDKYFSGGEEFDFLRCEKCGLYQISPKLPQEEINQYYLDDYMCYLIAVDDEPKFFSKIDRNRGIEKRCRQVIRNNRDGRSIIDIGCATGNFLKAMKNHGWDCIGVEPNRKAANYARDRFGLDIISGYLPQDQLQSDSFDVVSIWDVIEHVYDPDVFLDEVIRILKPGGIIIGSTPNAVSLERYLFGQFWAGWEVPRHYRCYTPKLLISLLQRKNLENINVFSFIGRHGVFMLSLDFWLNDWGGPLWLKKLIRAILGSMIIRIIFLPVFLILEIFNRSTVMSFTAEKPKEMQNNTK